MYDDLCTANAALREGPRGAETVRYQPEGAHEPHANTDRDAFWANLAKKRPKKERDPTALLKGRDFAAMRTLCHRHEGVCHDPDDAWRIFDATATAMAPNNKDYSGLVLWAEEALPGLAEWSLPLFDAYDVLEQRAKAIRRKRLTNAEFGQLLRLTAAERKAWGLNRWSVIECDLTPAMKRAETIERKERKRLAAEKRRREKGIKPRRSAKWRALGKSKATFYRTFGKSSSKLPTLQEIAPWKREGMPRRTWFRRAAADPGWRMGSILLSLPPKLRTPYVDRDLKRGAGASVAPKWDANVDAPCGTGGTKRETSTWPLSVAGTLDLKNGTTDDEISTRTSETRSPPPGGLRHGVR